MLKAFTYAISFFVILAMAYIKDRKKNLLFLPLGDSYTIGTGVSEKESWPYQLHLKLKEHGFDYNLPLNPARNGFTTQDLIEGELPLLKKGPNPDLISLLIGVNDWVQGVDKEGFRKNLVVILNEMQAHSDRGACVVVLTIPDFGKSPSGKGYARGRNISQGISEFNEVIKAETKKRNLLLVDIFPLSQNMETDNALIASDGLHPSGKEYNLWTELILKSIMPVINKKGG